ncbi:MAG: DNA repair protein RecN [Lachnospiraceae bacterium]|nr:DNA repair protein RecN [Lachnospiraceae bacterium]
MLYNLHVKDLAIIDEIEVNFDEGLNVLTGETGAGKSIIIGSVQLALGDRVPKGIIRDGAECGLVELIFSIENKLTLEVLKKNGISVEDNEVMLQRKIYANRTVNRINGETVTAKVLKEVSETLIDIHGQHEHQSLMNNNKHREILDVFAGEELEKLKAKLAEVYDSYKNIKKELDDNDLSPSELERELSFNEFELNEIEKANVKHGEEEELQTRYKKLMKADKLRDSLSKAYSLVGGAKGAGEMVSEAVVSVREEADNDETLATLLEEISQAEIMLEEFLSDAGNYLSQLDLDEGLLDKTLERLNTVKSIKSKYGNTVEEVNAYKEELINKVEKLKNAEKNNEHLKEELKKKAEEMKALAEEISEKRLSVRDAFDKAITEELKNLNFANINFKTEINKAKSITKDGMDEVYFMVSLNKGSSLKPLKDAASGGELSRIMLGLRSLFAREEDIPTLIFDEIDTGISGRTAQKVAEKMKKISARHQVICISHLAQIAAMADNHYLIEKSDEKDVTVTSIKRLNEEEEINEIARILGGVSITDAVIKSAREMKQMAKLLGKESL